MYINHRLVGFDMSDTSEMSDMSDLDGDFTSAMVPHRKPGKNKRDDNDAAEYMQPPAKKGKQQKQTWARVDRPFGMQGDVNGRVSGKMKRDGDDSGSDTRKAAKIGKPQKSTKKWARADRDFEELMDVMPVGRVSGKSKRDDDVSGDERPRKKGRPPKQPKKHRTASGLAGLTFPVTRTRRFLRSGGYSKRVGVGAGVYLAAVLEYLAREVLECTGDCTKDAKKKRITPRHIYLAVRNDIELNQFTKHATIPQGGVIPYIYDVRGSAK